MERVQIPLERYVIPWAHPDTCHVYHGMHCLHRLGKIVFATAYKIGLVQTVLRLLESSFTKLKLRLRMSAGVRELWKGVFM